LVVVLLCLLLLVQRIAGGNGGRWGLVTSQRQKIWVVEDVRVLEWHCSIALIAVVYSLLERPEIHVHSGQLGGNEERRAGRETKREQQPEGLACCGCNTEVEPDADGPEGGWTSLRDEGLGDLIDRVEPTRGSPSVSASDSMIRSRQMRPWLPARTAERLLEGRQRSHSQRARAGRPELLQMCKRTERGAPAELSNGPHKTDSACGIAPGHGSPYQDTPGAIPPPAFSLHTLQCRPQLTIQTQIHHPNSTLSQSSTQPTSLPPLAARNASVSLLVPARLWPRESPKDPDGVSTL